MRRPFGLKALRYALSGLFMWWRAQRAASASCGPPTSPIISTASVPGSFSNSSSMTLKDEPLTGSPPMPTEVDTPMPSTFIWLAGS
jgi:hypothetical protein